jgi:hypothetical protein
LREPVYAISSERKIRHPAAVEAILSAPHGGLFAPPARLIRPPLQRATGKSK